MDRADQAKVRSVIDGTNIYRRLPTSAIDCDPHLFLFLTRHPEIVTNIWAKMGLSNVDLRRTGVHSFAGNDQAGTEATIKVVYDSFEKQVIVAEGTYDAPVFRRTPTTWR